MKNIRSWPSFSTGISTRLGLGFGMLCILLVVVAFVSAARMEQMSNRFTGSLGQALPNISQLQDLLDEVMMLNITARETLLTDDESKRKGYLDRINKSRGQIGNKIDRVQKVMASGDELEKSRAKKIIDHSSGALVGLVQFSRLVSRGRENLAAKILATRLDPKLDALMKVVLEQRAYEMGKLVATGGQAQADTSNSKNIFAIVAIFSVVFATGIGIKITRSITSPLASAAKLGKAVAGGDLTVSISARGNDESAQLVKTMTEMRDGLARIVQGVRSRSESIALSASEIAKGNHDLSARTEDQATGLHETTFSADRITERVKKNAELAASANRLADGASQSATKGSEDALALATSVNQIIGHAKKVSGFIAVIDDIAFQTNILALNAAVEAARAGDHGRGFAVVAAEVRGLAQRASHAAQDIKPLIQATVDQVNSSAKQADLSAQSLRDIASSVSEVTNLVSSISAATRDQVDDLEQINMSISSLESSTQQNAALVEQVAAASSSSQKQVEELVQTVAVFTLPPVSIG